MIDREIFHKLTELKRQGVDAALATIVETVGSTPRGVGAKGGDVCGGRMFIFVEPI
jgi:xanthine/CO dehydrogenase XdhC/CoxF family maturation factor